MGAAGFCINSHSKIPKDRNPVVLDADIEGPKLPINNITKTEFSLP